MDGGILKRFDARYEIPDALSVIHEIAGMYRHPHLAFKEYISNSVDNRVVIVSRQDPASGKIKKIMMSLIDAVKNKEQIIEEIPEGIIVSINKSQRTISIQDDGFGLSPEEVDAIPRSIGTSRSKGIEGIIGGKAFGLFSFVSCGANQMLWVTKKFGSTSEQYTLCRMRKDESLPDITVRNVEGLKLIGVNPFAHGSRIILSGFEEEQIERYFTPAQIVDLTSGMFSPLIRSGTIKAGVGYEAKSQKDIIVPSRTYKGELVLEEQLEVEFEEGGQAKKGKLDVLLYLNPRGTVEKVALYNKGVRVTESLTHIDDLDCEPWNTGKLSGEVNPSFLTLVPARDAPRRDTNRYKAFVQAVRKYESRLSQIIKDAKVTEEKHESEEFGKEFLRTIDEVFREVADEYPVLVEGRNGDDLQKVKAGGKERASARMGGERQQPVKAPGRRVYFHDEEGEARVVRRARKIISSAYNLEFVDFDLGKENLMSELDTTFKVIRINTAHGNYKSALEVSGKDKKPLRRYEALLISKEAATGEFKRAVDENLIPPSDIHILTEMTAAFYQRGIRLKGLDR